MKNDNKCCFICLGPESNVQCSTCTLFYHRNCMLDYLKSVYDISSNTSRDPGLCPQCNTRFKEQLTFGIFHVSLGPYTQFFPICAYLLLLSLFIVAIVAFDGCMACSCSMQITIALIILPIVGTCIYYINTYTWIRLSNPPLL